MLKHMHDDVSYDDIVRQLHILRAIDRVAGDVETAGSFEGSGTDKHDRQLEPQHADERSPRIADTAPARDAPMVLRSHTVFSWRSLADRERDGSEPFIKRSSWI